MWQPKETAPKKGELIMGIFKNVYCPSIAMYNVPSDKWVLAIPQFDYYGGKLDDCYFDNEYIDDSELISWMEVPIAK